jgi:hypothetical protein
MPKDWGKVLVSMRKDTVDREQVDRARLSQLQRVKTTAEYMEFKKYGYVPWHMNDDTRKDIEEMVALEAKLTANNTNEGNLVVNGKKLNGTLSLGLERETLPKIKTFLESKENSGVINLGQKAIGMKKTEKRGVISLRINCQRFTVEIQDEQLVEIF